MSGAEEIQGLIKQLIDAGKLRDAAESCDEMNQRFPDHESGWYTASQLAMLNKEPIPAVRAIDRALQLSPGKPQWLCQRVECLLAAGDADAAKETARQLNDYRFGSASEAAEFTRILSRLGMFGLAKFHCERAVELEPDEGHYHYDLAIAERNLGNIQAADLAVTRCIELRPDDDDAHLLRAGLFTRTESHNSLEELEATYQRSKNQPQRRAKICYAMSKELEDIGKYERSFEFLMEGASLRRAGMQYTPQKDIDAIQRIRETYTPEMFDGHVVGHINAEPIFVVGMPRTATALIDRILQSHTVVYSAGALPAFSIELAANCQKVASDEGGDSTDLVSQSASIDFAALGEDYIAATRPATGKTAHFVDMLPFNFLYAGLIHLALPKAKIVLTERDPMDTCYAAYKTLFEGNNPYSYDLTEIANYFVAYRQLVEHWQLVMPGVIHVVKVEELAASPRSVVEDLLSYCGLSFDRACIEFFEDTEGSTSAGPLQVRGQAYFSSIGRWRHFEEQLKPVSDILGKINESEN